MAAFTCLIDIVLFKSIFHFIIHSSQTVLSWRQIISQVANDVDKIEHFRSATSVPFGARPMDVIAVTLV